MNKQLQLGLVIEGNATNSSVLRLPSLVEELGPVKSATVRVARRLSNMLRAGYAVSEYEELEASNLVLLRLPDSAVPRVVDELCASDLPLKNASFVLCESWLPVDVLQPLAARGSTVATLLKVPCLDVQWFMVEGDAKAVRQMRRFLTRNRVRSVELNQNCKHLFFASELLATTIPMTLLGAAQQTLRASGISGNILWTLLDQMARKMLVDFSRSPKADWHTPLNECSPETGQAYLDLLDKTSPNVAALLEYHLRSFSGGVLAQNNGSARAQTTG